MKYLQKCLMTILILLFVWFFCRCLFFYINLFFYVLSFLRPLCNMPHGLSNANNSFTFDFYCNHIFPSFRRPFHNCPTDIRWKTYFKDIHTELLIIDPFSRLENQEYIFIPPLNPTFKKPLLFIVTIMYG